MAVRLHDTLAQAPGRSLIEERAVRPWRHRTDRDHAGPAAAPAGGDSPWLHRRLRQLLRRRGAGEDRAVREPHRTAPSQGRGGWGAEGIGILFVINILANWWLPKWLDRILPMIQIAGEERFDSRVMEDTSPFHERGVYSRSGSSRFLSRGTGIVDCSTGGVHRRRATRLFDRMLRSASGGLTSRRGSTNVSMSLQQSGPGSQEPSVERATGWAPSDLTSERNRHGKDTEQAASQTILLP